MRRLLLEYRVFLGEFRRNFHTTGAILPSGRALAKALSRYVRQSSGPRRILEVGPGTGAVTAWIIRAMGPDDSLDLVELNSRFVEVLRQRLATDPRFAAAADRTRVLNMSVDELEGDGYYDLIISGLPLNNFAADVVERILATTQRLLAPGGTLSFFEYVAVRPLRGLVSGRAERSRLRGVGEAIQRMRRHEIRRDLVWPNVPPAWVHHCACSVAQAKL